MCFLMEDEEEDIDVAIGAVHWELTGFCVECPDWDDEEDDVRVDPCPSFFLKEPQFFT